MHQPNPAYMSIHVDRELDTEELGTEELDTDASNMDWGFAIFFPAIQRIYMSIHQ
jgi:hypothetical protein